MSYQPVFRDGLVHVSKTMCDTCIFRPGNLMDLEPGRVEEMIARTKRTEGVIPCHKTLGSTPSVCRGFFDKHSTPILQIAFRMGAVTFVTPPEEV